MELPAQFFDRYIHANIGVRAEHDAFFLHHRQAAVENTLLHLEFGDSITQKATNAIGTLIHRYPMAGLIQLSGRSQSRRTRSHDSNGLPCPLRRPAKRTGKGGAVVGSSR